MFLPWSATGAGIPGEPPVEQGNQLHAHAAGLLLGESLVFCQRPGTVTCQLANLLQGNLSGPSQLPSHLPSP